ncbi:hypothetical protein MmTuc01_1494 [Methanosarcina mazei Tuc01]|uniref:Uncharacterized protein n=1 Tax=Methanosarcina mazei Tuc01 TaxID=1236903 RepID=M1Q9J8_METMZ|nr:hypothetical protein MmTuc01_1494 [Methanosarcina mazei Tuc01]
MCSDMPYQPLLFETLLASSRTQAISPKARRYISPFITVQISIFSPLFYSEFLYFSVHGPAHG